MQKLKVLTWLLLAILLFLSVFHIFGADIDSDVIAIAVMMLLIVLIADLREFNFWGLSGKRIEKDLKELEGKLALTPQEGHATKVEINEAEKSVRMQFMDTGRGDFLAIAFEIERLMRIFATVNLARDIAPSSDPTGIISELREKGFLTEDGVKQLEAIRWLRNILVSGRQSEVTSTTLNEGTQIAWDLYQEIYAWLYPPEGDK